MIMRLCPIRRPESKFNCVGPVSRRLAVGIDIRYSGVQRAIPASWG
jgi:hypothetical protein